MNIFCEMNMVEHFRSIAISLPTDIYEMIIELHVVPAARSPNIDMKLAATYGNQLVQTITA